MAATAVSADQTLAADSAVPLPWLQQRFPLCTAKIKSDYTIS